MRAAIGAAVAAILVLAPACENCSCGGQPVMNLLISQQRETPIPVGLYQAVGFLIPGSGRNLTVSDASLVSEFPVLHQPDGSSLVLLQPTGGIDQVGKPRRFGGTVNLSATPAYFQAAWVNTILIATDPLSDMATHTYVGSGTTVMQVGQTFVIAWPVGAPAPNTSKPDVLTALGDPFEVSAATQQFGQGTITTLGKPYMEELLVAETPGAAVLNAPDAFNPLRDDGRVGPSQRFIVRDDPAWFCSPVGGCVSTRPVESLNTRPDSYIPPGGTGAPSPTPSLRPDSAPGP